MILILKIKLFQELGMIRAEYDAKAAVVEEQLAVLEEELPVIGERLRQRKKEMKKIKTDVSSICIFISISDTRCRFVEGSCYQLVFSSR